MNIVVTGGTGFIGKAIADAFTKEGSHVYILTRRPQPDRANVTFIEWLTERSNPWNALKHIPIDAFINVAGEPINKGRWTKSKKEAIVNSRISATQESLNIVRSLNDKPNVFISASAIGYYGYAADRTFTETSEPLENSFPSLVCKRWETEAQSIAAEGVRTAIARIGVVLGNGGGALPRMVLPYRLYAGGTIGTGKQWMSWIHINDLIGLIRFIIENKDISGPINLTAPEPITMEQLGRAIGSVLKRPHWFPVPEWVMKVAFGEMSGFLLKGQKVLPEKALTHHYEFQFPNVEDALRDLSEQ